MTTKQTAAPLALLILLITSFLLAPALPVEASVNLSAFYAESGVDTITLIWITANELDNLGFNLWRGTDCNPAVATKLNDNLIPSQVGGQPTGATYEFVDSDVVAGVVYDYRLESLDSNGTSECHQDFPVQASLSDEGGVGQPTPVNRTATPVPTSTRVPTNTARPTATANGGGPAPASSTPRPSATPTARTQPTVTSPAPASPTAGAAPTTVPTAAAATTATSAATPPPATATAGATPSGEESAAEPTAAATAAIAMAAGNPAAETTGTPALEVIGRGASSELATSKSGSTGSAPARLRTLVVVFFLLTGLLFIAGGMAVAWFLLHSYQSG